MAISSLALRTTNINIANACWELRAPSGGKKALVREIGFFITPAGTGTIGLGRPAAIGVGPVNVLFQMEDPNAAPSVMNAALSWATTAPTVPPIFLRRATAALSIPILWYFPRGLVVPAGGSIVLWNISASAVADVWCVLDE